jgi:hypothetical protein
MAQQGDEGGKEGGVFISLCNFLRFKEQMLDGALTLVFFRVRGHAFGLLLFEALDMCCF